MLTERKLSGPAFVWPSVVGPTLAPVQALCARLSGGLQGERLNSHLHISERGVEWLEAGRAAQDAESA